MQFALGTSLEKSLINSKILFFSKLCLALLTLVTQIEFSKNLVIIDQNFYLGVIKMNLAIKHKNPNIAQLVERPTVEGLWLSGGPWFESGCSDAFLILSKILSQLIILN